MRASEANIVLGYLVAAYPSAAVEPETLAIWTDELKRLRLTTSRDAAKAIVRTDHRFPALARFMEVYQALDRQRANDQAQTRGLPEPDRAPPPEDSLDTLVERGWITRERADRLVAASGGDANHAARVAAATGKEE